MIRYFIYFFSCVILIGCSGNSASDEMYDETLYVKVDSIDVAQKGYEVLISTVDTNRKLIKYFWPNGNIQMIAYYHNGQKDGTWRVFMDDGALVSATKYLNDKKEGQTLSYHPNGKVATVEKYHQGNAVDTWYYYDSLGRLIKTESYK